MSKETAIKVITESLEKIISGFLKEIQVQLPNLIVDEREVKLLEEFEVDFGGLKDSKFKKDKKVEEEVVQEESDYFSKEEIEKMKYNELKAYASELGLSVTGKKAEILERVLDKLYPDNKEEPEEQEELEDEEEPEVETKEDEDEDEDLEDTKQDKIAEMLEGYTEEELADLLEQVGKSPKGKRQALVSKIVDAIDEGLIEFEDDGEESEEEESDGEVKEDEEDEEDEEDIFKNVTEVRKDAIVELRKSIESMYKDGEIKDKGMKEFLEEYHEHLADDCNECDCPNGDRLDCYIKIQTNLIDDEGVQHDLGEPYIVNGNYYCCGRELSKLNDETLYCEICGQEYELE